MSGIPTFHSKPRSLAVWLAAGVGAFVLTGSLALMAVFNQVSRTEELAKLEVLGRANSLFVDQSTLPQSEHMAGQIGRVMGADATFLDPAQREFAQQPDGRATRTEDDRIRVGFGLRSGSEIWFSRDAGMSGAPPVWKRLDAQLALGGFWVLSLGFSLWLGRKITRPMAKLAGAIPQVGGDLPMRDLPDSGPIEIIRLAEVLRETHATLIEERVKRRHAERLALLGRMTSSLAHEVRNPVSAIRLHAQLMAEHATGEARSSSEVIIDEAERIDALVRQWLFYAKPAAVVLAPLDWGALARAVARSLDPQARHAEVRIQLEIDDHPAARSPSGDRERMRQVLANLLQNAIQCMPRGGVATLRVVNQSLEVEDQGGGFSPEALARFGEPFFSEREGGMGLGLAVVTEIVEGHGATLTAENLPGGGARVRISFFQDSSNYSSHGIHSDY